VSVCGFAGIISTRRQVPPHRLEQAIDALRHRGPDDHGWWQRNEAKQAVGLCATRLAIRDLSKAGHQPMVSPRTGVVLCFNGEIYNLEEVRGELLDAGYAFRGTSDTEVVLAAYDEWGANCLSRFNAMFAIAAWDPREARLFLARDRLGIKPLYYVVNSDGIAFASEIRALVKVSGAPLPLSAAGINSYLALGAVCEPYTMLDGAWLLRAGHHLSWSVDRGSEPTEYWSLRECFGSDTTASRDDAAANLRARLRDAVSMQLGSDVPIGVFLSGGIDSGSLVALASGAMDRPPATFSLVFEDPKYSEAELIELIAHRYGTDHMARELSGSDLLALLPDALDAMDQPTVDGINTYAISKLARQAGLTVALSGIGGDELFAGYRSFVDVPRIDRLTRLLPGRMREPAVAVARRRLQPDRGAKLARSLGVEASRTDSAYGVYRELFAPSRRAALQGMDIDPQVSPPEGAAIADPTNAVSYMELTWYTRNMLLRDADVMSMAHGLEVRVPFLDHRLVEYVASLSGSLKRRRGMQKPLLVDALDGALPEEIRTHPKRGFTLPFNTWLRSDLRSEVEGTLLDREAGGAIADALDSRETAAIWRSFLEGRLHWSRPWALYALKHWGERYRSGDRGREL
jgi:asparagine synthase (glutamine-hydrolysing)